MWNAMARQKNSYLHSILKTKHIGANSINYCVDCALTKNISMQNDTIPNFCNPSLVEPKSFGVKIFKNKARIAYGLAGVPKLIKEISSPDGTIQSQALHSLSEELQDPYKYSRALKDFHIVKKLGITMGSWYPNVRNDSNVLEHLVTLIGIIASHHEGAKQLIEEHQIISCLYDMIVDDECISKLAAKALMRMSSQPEVADLMASRDHIQRVLRVLHKVEIITEVYEELANLIERSPAKAIDEGCFRYLCPRIKCRDEFQPYIVKCFAFLLNNNKAQESCDLADVPLILYELLSDDSTPLMTREYLSLAIMSVLYSTRAMWRCQEFWDLPLLLIKNAHNKESAQMQLWSLQALRQLTMMPSIKDFVRKTCKKNIKNISCLNESVEKSKTKLLTWLRTKTYVIPDSDTNEDDDFENQKSPVVDSKRKECRFVRKTEDEKDGKTLPLISYRLDYAPVKGSDNKTDTLNVEDASRNVPCPNV